MANQALGMFRSRQEYVLRAMLPQAPLGHGEDTRATEYESRLRVDDIKTVHTTALTQHIALQRIPPGFSCMLPQDLHLRSPDVAHLLCSFPTDIRHPCVGGCIQWLFEGMDHCLGIKHLISLVLILCWKCCRMVTPLVAAGCGSTEHARTCLTA